MSCLSLSKFNSLACTTLNITLLIYIVVQGVTELGENGIGRKRNWAKAESGDKSFA